MTKDFSIANLQFHITELLKKHLQIFCFLVVFFAGSITRICAQQNIQLGISYGKTFSGASFKNNLSGYEPVRIHTSLDKTFGVQIQIGLSDRVYIRTGVMLVQKGVLISNHLTPEHPTLQVRYNNAELPLGISTKIQLAKNFFVRQNIGAEFEIIEFNDGYHYPRGWVNENEFVFIEEMSRHFSGNIFAGCDLEWQNKSDAIFSLNISYHQGLDLISKGELIYKNGDEFISQEVLINGSFVSLTLSCFLPDGNIRNLFGHK